MATKTRHPKHPDRGPEPKARPPGSPGKRSRKSGQGTRAGCGEVVVAPLRSLTPEEIDAVARRLAALILRNR